MEGCRKIFNEKNNINLLLCLPRQMSLYYGPDLSRNSNIKKYKHTFIMLHVYMIPEILLIWQLYLFCLRLTLIMVFGSHIYLCLSFLMIFFYIPVFHQLIPISKNRAEYTHVQTSACPQITLLLFLPYIFYIRKYFWDIFDAVNGVKNLQINLNQYNPWIHSFKTFELEFDIHTPNSSNQNAGFIDMTI